MRVVLQCKLYSQPVGNKAVQEVVAARNFERARFGVVVSNNSYTTPAQTLASANGVHLIHHRELAGLENLLRNSTY
jgi:restriction system protein